MKENERKRINEAVQGLQMSKTRETEEFYFNKIIEYLSPQINKLVYKYSIFEEKEDVRNEIYEVVYKTAKLYDFNRAEFRTYLLASIKNYFIIKSRNLQSDNYAITVCCNVCGELGKLRKDKGYFRCKNGHIWREKSQNLLSLDEKYDIDGSIACLIECVADEYFQSTNFYKLDNFLFYQFLKELNLPIKEKGVIYFLSKGYKKSEISNKLNLSVKEINYMIKKLSKNDKLKEWLYSI